jgi:cell division septation protein DedD
MKKIFPLKSILKLGVLFLALTVLVPKWFFYKTPFSVIITENTQQIENLPKTIAQPLKTPEPMTAPDITTKNIVTKKDFILIDTKNKDIPNVWCIAFDSFASYEQAKNFAKKLEDNNFPVFIVDKEKYRLDPVMLSSQIKNEVIIGPEIDREIIEKHLKNLAILGIKGKITKFNIL